MEHDAPGKLEPYEIGSAISAFMSELCPCCGVAKSRFVETFCESCFERLTPELQAKILDHQQYIGTFHPALAFLMTSKAQAA